MTDDGQVEGLGHCKPTTWQDRVRDELEGLQKKARALDVFMYTNEYSGLSRAQRVLLLMQVQGMSCYANALKFRLSQDEEEQAEKALELAKALEEINDDES